MIKSALRTSLVYIFPKVLNQRLRNSVLRTPLTKDYPYEPEAKLIRNIVPLNKPFFDIGANTGFYSIIIEDLVGANNVYSFEPLHRPYLVLRKRRRPSRVFEIAMSCNERKAIVKVPFIKGKRFEWRGTLEKNIMEQDQTGYEEVETYTTTIDHFIRKHGLNSLGFLKIDVEEHECRVIEGGVKSIKDLKPIMLIEIEQRHHKRPIFDIFSSIESIGFRGYYLNALELKMYPIEHFLLEKHQDIEKHKSMMYINNFLFFPEIIVKDIVKKVYEFLEKEKRLVEHSLQRTANRHR